MRTSTLLLGLSALATPSFSLAQQPVPVVLEGDLVPGAGHVVDVERVAVGDLGQWIVQVKTSGPGATQAILSSAAPPLLAGTPLSAPPGGTLYSAISVAINDAGHGAYTFYIGGTGSSTDDTGVFWDSSLLIQEGSLSGAPQFSAGTVYKDLSASLVNDANQVLVLVAVDDPALGGGYSRALMRLATDGAGGLLSETAILKKGDPVGPFSWPVVSFPSPVSQRDFNDLGSAMYVAQVNSGTSADHAVCIDGTTVAYESGTSPIPGRPWLDLSIANVSLNNHGEWALTGRLEGDAASNELIERSGAPFHQEGESLAAIAPYTLTGFGQGRLQLGDSGRLLWFATWNSGGRQGLFLDDDLIVEAGVTSIGGQLVEYLVGPGLLGDPGGFALSGSGRYALFEAALQGGGSGAFLIDLAGPGTSYCAGDGGGTLCPCGNAGGPAEGCANSTGSGAHLSHGAGQEYVGVDDLQLAGAGLVPGQPALLFAGLNATNGGAGVPFGDGLRCAGGGVVRLGVRVPDGGGSASWGPGLCAAGGITSGSTRYFQAWYRDPVAGSCGSGFNLSNGFSVLFLP